MKAIWNPFKKDVRTLVFSNFIDLQRLNLFNMTRNDQSTGCVTQKLNFNVKYLKQTVHSNELLVYVQ